MFQGYGTIVADNFFDHIRCGVRGRAQCNSVPIQRNTFSITCGSDSSSAAIELLGASGNTLSGGTISDNTIEVTNYVYAIKATYATYWTIGPNGIWDAGGSFVAGVRCEVGATNNRIVDGNLTSGKQLLYEDVTVAGQNTVLAISNGTVTGALQPLTHDFIANPPIRLKPNVTGTVPALVSVDNNGNITYAQPAPVNTNGSVGLQILTANAQSFADGATTSGSNVLTSATAAFTTADVGCMVAGSGIAAGSRIIRRVSATSVELSRNCTATASGVTFTIGGNAPNGTRNPTSVAGVMFENNHLRFASIAPTIALQAAAGTGATSSFDTGSNDSAGILTLNIGTGPALGLLFEMTLANTLQTHARCVITPGNANAAAAATNVYVTFNSVNKWRLTCIAALTASQAYIWNYILVG
jgi:hypothetical protein